MSTSAAAVEDLCVLLTSRLNRWSGTFFFETGTADVACDMVIPSGQYVHGYTLNLHGNRHTFTCEKTTKLAASNWTCSVSPLLSATPLADGATFVQQFNVVNRAHVRTWGVFVGTIAMVVVSLLTSSGRGWE